MRLTCPLNRQVFLRFPLPLQPRQKPIPQSLRQALIVAVAFAWFFTTLHPRMITAEPSPDQQVDQLLQTMTLDQKAGQLFMVSIYGVGLTDTAASFLNQMQPGPWFRCVIGA